LIGAPPGYVGFEDAEPVFEQIRQRPYSILLLDEIEKAHPDVFNILLPILEDGKTKDNHEKVIMFNNVIILMTTNAGAAEAMKLIENGGKAGMGFGDSDADTPEKMKGQLEKIYEKSRQQANGGPFRPEMINRIEMLGGFVTYVPLAREVVANIAKKQIGDIGKRLGNADGQNLPGITLEVSDAVMEELCKQGYNPAMGARPMQKVIREKVINPLTKWIMENRAEVEKASQAGGAKIVITSLEMNALRRYVTPPTLAKNDATANDNKTAAKKTAIKKKVGENPSL
ncbi:MAG: AAA family ATPase, partial [Alphaproteobacteria bacterium]|nr:AAA family ATPase [Alphaproteobacteria bacterium]